MLPVLDVLSTVGSTWLPLVAQASVGTELVSPQAVTVLGASVAEVWCRVRCSQVRSQCREGTASCARLEDEHSVLQSSFFFIYKF